MSKKPHLVFDGRTSSVQVRNADLEAGRTALAQQLYTKAFIPVELLNQVGQSFTKGLDTSGANAVNLIQGTIVKGDKQNYNKAVAHLTHTVNKIRYAYYTHYVGLLTAMDELVKDPGIPARGRKYVTSMGPNGKKVTRYTNDKISFSKQVKFRPSEPGGVNPLGPATTIPLVGQWPALAPMTMAKKKLSGRSVFWAQTGEASNAFHAKVVARLAKIKPRSFETLEQSHPTLIGDSTGKIGAGRFAAQAKFRFKMGIPSWDAKMDTLITIPFATRRTTVSTLVGTGLDRTRVDGVSKWKSGAKKLHGVDRLLVAEAYRPWLRSLSAQAGSALQRYVRSGSTAVTNNPEARDSLLREAAKDFKAKKLVQKARSNQAAEKKRRDLVKGFQRTLGQRSHNTRRFLQEHNRQVGRRLSPEERLKKAEAAKVQDQAVREQNRLIQIKAAQQRINNRKANKMAKFIKDPEPTDEN
jgi:hypothetical protein